MVTDAEYSLLLFANLENMNNDYKKDKSQNLWLFKDENDKNH